MKGGLNNEFLSGYESVGEKVLAQEKYKAYKEAQDKLEAYNPQTEYEAYRKAVDEFRANFSEEAKSVREETAMASIEFIKANPDVECAALMLSRNMSNMQLKDEESEWIFQYV